MTEIECHCGAVRVELSGEPRVQFFCHCDDCQAMHGAAYIPVAMYPAEAVKVTRGTPRVWSLKATARTTCPECGTRMFAEVPQAGARCVSGFLLPPSIFRPAFHMQCRFAVRPVRDDLPHFAGFPAAFGGSNETMDW